MAKTCDLINKTTQEPKVFYKTDSGNIVSSIQEAISDSVKSFEFGIFKNDTDFKPLGTSPIYDKNSVEGLVQSFIGEGVLEAKVINGKQIFSATGETPLIQAIVAEAIEEKLRTKVGGAHFTRKGESFDVQLNKEYTDLIKNSLEYTFEEALEVFPAEKAADMGLFKFFSNSKTQTKNSKYTSENLKEAIEDLLGDLGISITNIEDYSKKYKIKNGVEPTAEALADITNRIIAVAEGKETLDNLTEETSHFIVEGWNSQEIDRLLEFIPQTKQYKEHASNYKNIYSKEGLNEGSLENKVRREILGKILAESLQDSTDISSKDEVEQNIFKKVLEIFENWLNNLINRITPSISNDITEFTKEVKNMLYNKQLSNTLDLSNSSGGTYYSLKIGPEFVEYQNETGRLLDQLFQQFKTSKTSPSNTANFLTVMNLIERNIDKIMATNSISGFKEEIKTLVQEIAPLAKNSYSRVLQENHDNPLLQEKIRKVYNKVLQDLSDLEATSNGISANKTRDLLQEMVDSFNAKNSDPKKRKEFEELLEDKINSVQSDTSWAGKMFMPLYLSSNIFQQMLGSIVMKMWINVNLTMEREITPRIYKLANNIKAVQNLMGDDFIRSFNKNDILQKDIDLLKKQILKDHFPSVVYSETDTMGDIESSLKEELPLFKTFFNVAISNNELSGLSLKNTDQLDMFEKLKFLTKINNKLVVEPSTLEQFKVYLNYKQGVSFENSRIRREYDITDDNFHTQQSALRRWVSASKSVFSQDIDLKNIDSTNLNNFISSMNEFVKPGLKLGSKKTKNSVEINMLNNDGTGDNLFLTLTDSTNNEAVIAFYEQAAGFINVEKNKNTDTSSRQENFKKAWEHFLKKSIASGLTPNSINVAAVNWLKYNSSFTTENNFTSSGSKFNKINIVDAIGDDKWDSEVEGLVGRIDALYRQKSAILSVVREQGDFKEIAGSEISDSQRVALREIEENINDLIKELSDKTGSDTEIFESMGDESLEVSANNSYRSLFNYLETPYEDVLIMDLEKVFKKEASISQVNKYTRLKTKAKDLIEKGNKATKSQTYKMNEDLMDSLVKKLNYKSRAELFQDFKTDSIKVNRALMEMSLPSEYKRFDKPEHLDFIREVEGFQTSIEDLIEGRITIPEGLVLEPSFIHDSEFDNSKSKKELIIEYAENATTLSYKEKFEILNQLDDNNQYNIEDKYKDNDFLKDINSSNLAESYTALTDMMILSLHNYGKYNHNVFSLPNFRKTERDTFISLLNSKNKSELKNKTKVLIQEAVAYRADEMADSTTGAFSFIPKTGFMTLSKEERSSDMLHLYSTMLSQSILYKNRSESLKDALVIVDEAETKEYEGVSASQSNTVRKLKEFVDIELYGKKEIRKLERKVLGHTIDFSKLIHSMRKFITANSLGLSPIIAATAYTTSRSAYEILKRSGLNREIYMPADSRASMEWKKLLGGTVASIGTVDGASKMEEILRMYGGYTILDRTSNAKFNRASKVLETEKIAYGALKMAEYPVLTKLVLSKLMEYRLIGDKFMTFEEFKNGEEGKTEDELKKEFNSYSSKSLYDYTLTDIDADSLFKEAIKLDPSLNAIYNSSKTLPANEKIARYSKASSLFKNSVKNRINLIQLSKDGYDAEEYLDEDIVNITLQITDIKSRLTQQLPKGGTVLAQNDTALSFVMTFRQWLVQAVHNTTTNQGVKDGLYIPFHNFNTGVTQIGQAPSLYNLIYRTLGKGENRTEDNKKAFFAFKTAWENADPSEKVALRSLAMSTVLWGAMGALTAVALGYADDDDEQDNALAQFSSYLTARTMKEGFGSTNPVGLFNEMLGILSNPITVGRSVKSMAGLLAVWNVNDEVKSGQYEGMPKYWVDAFKLTLLKNIQQQTNAAGLIEARTGYRHFSAQDSWLDPFIAVEAFEANNEEDE